MTWLDLLLEDSHHKGRKKWDPNHVFEAFSLFSDHDAYVVREEMLSAISSKFNYYQTVSWLKLQLHKTTLSEWCHFMHCVTTPADELAIFALSRLYRQHSVVYTKDKTWSTIGTSTSMSEKEVYQQCDLKFILMGKGHYVQLIRKPSLTMPVLPLQPMESVYESGYYENTAPAENIKATTSAFTSPPAEPPLQRNEEIATTMYSKQYCAVHGCKVPDTKTMSKSTTPYHLNRK